MINKYIVEMKVANTDDTWLSVYQTNSWDEARDTLDEYELTSNGEFQIVEYL